jgi:hypothetical protein
MLFVKNKRSLPRYLSMVGTYFSKLSDGRTLKKKKFKNHQTNGGRNERRKGDLWPREFETPLGVLLDPLFVQSLSGSHIYQKLLMQRRIILSYFNNNILTRCHKALFNHHTPRLASPRPSNSLHTSLHRFLLYQHPSLSLFISHTYL